MYGRREDRLRSRDRDVTSPHETREFDGKGGGRKGEVSKMRKRGALKETGADQRSCGGNGPGWGDSDVVESDDNIEISHGIGRNGEKSDGRFGSTNTKKIRSGESGGGPVFPDGLEFKIILRFGEQGGVSAMSPVKLTTVLKNQIGGLLMAKVLRDGNLLIVCRNEEQRVRADNIKEMGRFKVASTSSIQR